MDPALCAAYIGVEESSDSVGVAAMEAFDSVSVEWIARMGIQAQIPWLRVFVEGVVIGGELEN